jgi:hypothetical protein
MISWALMAIDSTLEHSKTLGKTPVPNLSTPRSPQPKESLTSAPLEQRSMLTSALLEYGIADEVLASIPIGDDDTTQLLSPRFAGKKF